MGSQPESRPTLVLNPSDDVQFRTAVETSMENGSVTPAQLQGRLREQYPQVVVRPRELSGERAQVWYVYLHGHWVRPGG